MLRGFLFATATGSVLLASAGLSSRIGALFGTAVMPAQAAPAGEIDIYNSAFPLERGECLAASLGSSAASECGDLRVEHALPSVRVFNSTVTPTLIYNSRFAHPYGIVPIRLTQLITTTTPDSVEVQVFVFPRGGTAPPTPRVTRRWAGSEWPSGQTTTRRISIAYDAINDTTGVWFNETRIANVYPGNVKVWQTPKLSQVFLVNRSTSPFGAGWWPVGLEQVKKTYTYPPGNQEYLWVGGDGSTRMFQLGYANMYDRLDSLQVMPGSLLVRRLPEGRRVEFDSATGRHWRTINRFGRTTTFKYTGALLDSIGLPGPTAMNYRFTYSGGKLTTIEAPPVNGTQRITSVTITSGNLTAIKNAGDSTVSFGYLPAAAHQHLMNQRTNRRNVPTTFTYDSALKVRTSSINPNYGGGTITLTVTAGESRGLPKSGTPSSVDTLKVYTNIDGPRNIADSTRVFQEQFGSPRRSIDAAGAVTHMRRGYINGPSTYDECWVLHRLKRPLDHVVLYFYDQTDVGFLPQRGNLTQVVDSMGPYPGGWDITRYVWDQTFDQLMGVVPPEKDSVMFGVNASNGRREWQQDVRGMTSRIDFFYDDASYPEQVSRVVLPVVNGSSATYNYSYHSTLRNTLTETTPKGFATTYSYDGVGRVLTIDSPVDSLLSSTARVHRGFVYSLRDDLTRDTTKTLNVTPSEEIVVRNAYNPEAQLDTLERTMSPDPGSIGLMRSVWRRDNAGRVIAAVAPDGRVDSTTYNQISKPHKLFSRRWVSGQPGSAQPVTILYDVIGRDSIRTVPSLAYGTLNLGIPIHPNNHIYGLDSAYRALTIPTVADTFLYDAEGRVVSAKNRWSRITKTYTKKGRDSTEVQNVADLGGSFGLHSYLTRSYYDRNGRRTKYALPTQLGAPAGKDTIRWSYTTWGQLNSSFDPDGNEFRYTYTERGEPIKLEFMQSGSTPMSQRWTYDPDGRLLRDTVANPDTTFPRWIFVRLRAARHRYDGRDKLLWRDDSLVFKDSTRLTYSGLGTLIKSKFTQAGVNQGWGPNVTVRFGSTDSLVVDPLGNVKSGWTYDTTQVSGQPSQAVALPRDATYQSGVGRILTVGQSIPGIRTFVYDSAGNEAFSYLVGDAGGNHPSEDRRSYYDASGRLVAAEWRFLPSQGNPGTYGYKRAFEEYRHDPLGRRIWVRAQRDCYLIPSTMPDLIGLSIECSRSFVRRTIWDGQQEVAEIQAPDNATDREVDGSYFSAQALINGKDPNPYYGRAIYTYGHTIDQPLSIFRLGYADWPQGAPSYTTSAWGTFVVMPFWDATGNARIGTYGTGAAVRQLVPAGSQCVAGNSPQRCVKLYWPESFTALDRLKGFTPQMYVASLLDRKRDATGTEFKRNRVYDPKTGRFTQEDPIGLLGGLNLYGFAAGDPVNFGDPFGLCPKDMGGNGRTKWLTDCPEGSKGRAEWNRRASGRAEGVDDPVFLLFGGVSAKGAKTAATTIGGRIARGHAFVRHVLEEADLAGLGIRTREQLGRFVDDIISKSSGTNVRSLSRGRRAFWDDETGAVVIHDPRSVDFGTVFRPRNGRAYFDGLR